MLVDCLKQTLAVLLDLIPIQLHNSLFFKWISMFPVSTDSWYKSWWLGLALMHVQLINFNTPRSWHNPAIFTHKTSLLVISNSGCFDRKASSNSPAKWQTLYTQTFIAVLTSPTWLCHWGLQHSFGIWSRPVVAPYIWNKWMHYNSSLHTGSLMLQIILVLSEH